MKDLIYLNDNTYQIGSVALLWRNTKCNVNPGLSHFERCTLACARLIEIYIYIYILHFVNVKQHYHSTIYYIYRYITTLLCTYFKLHFYQFWWQNCVSAFGKIIFQKKWWGPKKCTILHQSQDLLVLYHILLIHG